MMFFFLMAFGLVGFISGMTSRLFGVSGGVVATPLLLFVFRFMPSSLESFPHLMQVAIGTSFASMFVNALISIFNHNKRKAIDWGLIRWIAPGLILGTFFGSLFASNVKNEFLQKIFGIFECLIGVYCFFPLQRTSGEYAPLSHRFSFFLGSIIGLVSSILGIGGGLVATPIFLMKKMGLRRANGTSAGMVLITTTFGAICYMGLGLNEFQSTRNFGYAYYPAIPPMVVMVLVGAPFGSKLAQTLPTTFLRKLFAAILILTGVLLILF